MEGVIRYRYYEIPGIPGKLTVAYMVTETGNEIFPYEFSCGIAYQSVNDTFNKKTGRKIALERLEENIEEGDVLPITEDELKSYILHDYEAIFINHDIIHNIAPYRYKTLFSEAETIILEEFRLMRLI